MPHISIITFPLKIKLIALSLLFAALKHYGQLDWEWVSVAAPILLGSACTFLEYLRFYVTTYSVVVFGDAQASQRYCDRLESKINKNHSDARKAIAKVRKAIREMKG